MAASSRGPSKPEHKKSKYDKVKEERLYGRIKPMVNLIVGAQDMNLDEYPKRTRSDGPTVHLMEPFADVIDKTIDEAVQGLPGYKLC